MAAPVGISLIERMLGKLEDITTLDLLKAKDESVARYFPESSFSVKVLEVFKKRVGLLSGATKSSLQEKWTSHPTHAQAAITEIFDRHITSRVEGAPAAPSIAIRTVWVSGPRGHAILSNLANAIAGAGHGKPIG